MSFRPVCTWVSLAILTFTQSLVAAGIPKPSPEQVIKELDALWADLLSPDELVAGRAMLRFALHRHDAIDYLKDKLRPLKLSNTRAQQLLADLGVGSDAAVRAAFYELSYLDPRLALGDEGLRAALSDRPESCRLGAVLCDLPIDVYSIGQWHWNSPDNKVYRFNQLGTIENFDIAIEVAGIGKQGRKLSWVRATRAIAVLEYLGTPGAVKILEKMTTGHRDAAPTKAAKVALKRLGQK